MTGNGRAPDTRHRIERGIDALVREANVLLNAGDNSNAREWDRIASDIANLCDIAHEYTSGVESGEDTSGLPPFRPLLEVDPNAQIAWLVDELLIAGDLALLVGPDGVMKTTIAETIGLACAGGYKLFGRFGTVACPVLFISGEDPEGVLRNRADALCRGHGWDSDRVLGNVHVLALAGVDMRSPLWQQHIGAAVAALKPGLVIFDPLAELATGDENSNPERGILVRAFRQICADSGATVLIIHHFKKATEGTGKADLIRGGNALKNAARATYALEKGPDGGIVIECVKFSRAPKRATFVVRPHVTVDERNEALWVSARLEFTSVREATLDAADQFVRDALAGGARMTTTDLKAAAKGTGVSGADIARALKILTALKAIDFEPGERGAKLWGLTLPVDSRQGRQGGNDLAGQATTLPGNLKSGPSTLPATVGGKLARVDDSAFGQGQLVSAEDAA